MLVETYELVFECEAQKIAFEIWAESIGLLKEL